MKYETFKTMKKNVLTLLVLLCGLLLSGSVQAQREIQFSYDNSGNMTSRVIYIPTPPTTPATQAENPADPVNQNNETDNTDTTEVKKPEVFIDQLGNQDIKFYPNPTQGKLAVEISNYDLNAKGKIQVFDMGGRLVQNISNLSQQLEVDISNEPAGSYIMVIVIGQEKSEWKIIKQ